MKIVSFLLLIAWCWCLWLFLYLQTSRTTTPAADASGYLKRFAILRNLVRLQKPEVKAPQSKVVSYGTSFFLVAEGSSVVSTSSENQKLLQLSDLRKRETGGSAWRKMGGPLGKQWESVKLEGQVHVRPLCDITQIQSHYRADPSLLWGAHPPSASTHRVCERQPEYQREKSAIGRERAIQEASTAKSVEAIIMEVNFQSRGIDVYPRSCSARERGKLFEGKIGGPWMKVVPKLW